LQTCSVTTSIVRIAIAAKCRGIEVIIAFKNIFIQIAYNEPHQLAVVKQLAEFIESQERETDLFYFTVTDFARLRG
jgi:hypothetical protein